METKMNSYHYVSETLWNGMGDFRVLAFTMLQGSILLSLAVLVLGIVIVLRIHGFLAISVPVAGDILVVEGWIWQLPAMREAMEEFHRGHYIWLVTVGEPVEGAGEASNYKSSAELAAIRLRELGVNKHRIVELPVPAVRFHRTYASALRVKSWLIRSKTKTTGINVFTLGAHARKSLVLFKRALGPEIAVGVIAGKEDTYNPHLWWLSAKGIYVITRKTLGYLYAVLWPLPQFADLQ
jgi:DUF218 domain-containing protein